MLRTVLVALSVDKTSPVHYCKVILTSQETINVLTRLSIAEPAREGDEEYIKYLMNLKPVVNCDNIDICTQIYLIDWGTNSA